MANARYLVYRLVRRWLPPGLTYALASRDRTPPERLIGECNVYARLLAGFGIPVRGSRVIEVGPGTYNPFSLLLFRRGVREVLLQEPFLRNLDYALLRKRLAVFWPHVPAEVGAATELEALFSGTGFRPEKVRLGSGFAESLDCPDGWADLLLSSHVMQFVPDVRRAFREFRRVLKPGGFMLHIVDLRDHYFRYPFEMLTFPPFVWHRLLTSLKGGRGFHNRLRRHGYLDLCAATGFTRIESEILDRDPPALARVKDRLHAHFRGYPDEELCIIRTAVSAQKPPSA